MEEVILNDLVSIITPSYNSEQYIAETIRCVLAQTYTNWELLIVDDCSQDESVKVIKGFDDERIHLFYHSKNSGAAAARNLALSKARGRWIAFLDSDDLWLPEKLEVQVAFMEENGYSFSYSKYLVMDEESGEETIVVSGPKHISKGRMYDSNWVGCLTVMYDQNVIGVLNIPSLRMHDDYALWLKAIHFADCHLCPHVLARYRKRSNSVSRISKFLLLRYLYIMLRESDNRSRFVSFVYTVRNALWSIYKKKVYYKAIR